MEHHLSKADIMSELDQIEARLKAATPGAVTITPTDVAYLLTLARKQAAALEAVTALAEHLDAHAPHRWAADSIRTALEATK